MKLRAIICAFTAICLAGWAAPDDKAPEGLEQLDWLFGAWVEKKNGVETEEHWIAPKGGLMLGVNRTVRASGKTEFEFLRIAKTSKGISYFASPGGRPPVEFPMLESSAKRVVFENPKHDFPQRISYWMEPDGKLAARIEGTINGKKRAMEWRWEKGK